LLAFFEEQVNFVFAHFFFALLKSKNLSAVSLQNF